MNNIEEIASNFISIKNKLETNAINELTTQCDKSIIYYCNHASHSNHKKEK